MKCLSCGSVIPDDSVKCPDCGEQLQKQRELTAGSSPKKRFTYDSLGSRRDFLLRKGPKTLCAVLALTAVAATVIYYISLLFSKHYEEIKALLIVGIPVYIPLIVQLVYLKKAGACIRSEEYGKAWEYAGKSRTLHFVYICYLMCFLIIAGLAGSFPFIALALLAALLGLVFYCSRVAANARKSISDAEAQQEEAVLAAGGGLKEENTVQPVNQTKTVLVSVGVIAVFLLPCILILITGKAFPAFVAFAVFIAVIIALIVKEKIDRNNWKTQGLWHDRPDQYYLHPRIFLTEKVSFDRVIEEIKKSDFALSQTHWSTNHDGRISFIGYNKLFEGMLSEFAYDDPEKSKFVFNFSHFVRGRGSGAGAHGLLRHVIRKREMARGDDIKKYEIWMNLCLTQVEQAILRIDPNADIRSGS